MKYLWGIDLGGTKIEGIVLKPGMKGHEVVARIRIPTNLEMGYEYVLGRIGLLVRKLKKVSGLEPDIIGFGTPGTIDAESGLIKNSNSICYNRKPLQDDLGDQLGIPVILENDANCFALAETHFGIVREIDPGASVVFGIIMGTGVGGGIVVEGQVIKGKHGIGGEWGHNYLDGSGGKCYCGRTGCVETVLSGPALEKYYFRASGIEKKLPEIYRDYAKEKKYAVLTMDRLVHFFGKAVAVVINIIDPDVIVIGGGLGNMEILYTRGKEELRKYIFNHSVFCKIVRPKLGDSAGVFGAAALGMKV